MTAVDPLADLKDIHLPPPIGIWPPAPGWWILAILLLIALIVIGRKLFLYWRRTAYRRAAARALKNLHAEWQRHNDDNAFARSVNQLLKQTALTTYPREQVAALNGRAWLDFLDQQLRSSVFNATELQGFGDQYRAQTTVVPAAQLHDAALLWIRKHKGVRKHQGIQKHGIGRH